MDDCVKIPNSPSTSILFVVDLHKFNVVPEVVKYIFEIQLKLWFSPLLLLVCDVVHPFQSCDRLVTSLARLCEPATMISCQLQKRIC